MLLSSLSSKKSSVCDHFFRPCVPDQIYRLCVPDHIFRLCVRGQAKLASATRWQPRPHCSLLATLAYVGNFVLYKRLVSYHTAFSLRPVV